MNLMNNEDAKPPKSGARMYTHRYLA